jgi:hypothetical protein
MRKPDLSLDIDAAVQAIRVHDRDGGPSVPENPLGRLIADTPDQVQLPSRRAVLARMRTARIAQLKSIFMRQHLDEKPK